jgi:hypothetical protein
MRMSKLILQESEVIAELTKRLGERPLITKYGPDEPETLAHSFSDLEESFHRFLGEQLPKLIDSSTTGDVLDDLLLDIREEVRHILYHLQDPEFFRILEPSHPKART